MRPPVSNKDHLSQAVTCDARAWYKCEQCTGCTPSTPVHLMRDSMKPVLRNTDPSSSMRKCTSSQVASPWALVTTMDLVLQPHTDHGSWIWPRNTSPSILSSQEALIWTCTRHLVPVGMVPVGANPSMYWNCPERQVSTPQPNKLQATSNVNYFK